MVSEKCPIDFYYQRGLAAMNAGLVGRALRDFARSLDVGARTGTQGLERVRNALANAQLGV